ncbi:hypothetical protein RB6925 [Rhodopirellula baltica SH 1]|uniref:Uncharacterized protein n=1 Tax=Rhodopirellula baltica (strain DSM 10527 / NCIMB 13988 / SH1) TaxID=243090 RepID=Q7UPH9_RHOBA|nr:hypothetical protein RB6925 [Rhodopirellula baltica SH 1]
MVAVRNQSSSAGTIQSQFAEDSSSNKLKVDFVAAVDDFDFAWFDLCFSAHVGLLGSWDELSVRAGRHRSGWAVDLVANGMFSDESSVGVGGEHRTVATLTVRHRHGWSPTLGRNKLKCDTFNRFSVLGNQPRDFADGGQLGAASRDKSEYGKRRRSGEKSR